MSDARKNILGRLRAAQADLPEIEETVDFRPMVPSKALNSAELRAHFIREATKLNCIIHEVEDEDAAFAVISQLVGANRRVAAWDDASVPIAGFTMRMANAGFQRVSAESPHAEIGITGVDAALAATGSLVFMSAPGKVRSTSLLPATHIAIVRAMQIVTDLETWFAQQRDDALTMFQDASNVIIISGPSRTADIGMELVLGAHGPHTLHIILPIAHDDPAGSLPDVRPI
ncbi:MAG: lactate utilization protein [Anaerolineae bacterium]|nr:lactate utilization protein [Anaerolineae bacterium]MCO5190870.1 lactate utilization protein [Anaerolineae bacterium]MCO5206853.1 lactate utilization protein [Anaerolineae bacterium]